MPTDIFMSIEDAEGSVITEGACSKESIGAFYKAQHEDEILVFGFDHKVCVPTDRRTGQVTGNRKHEHLIVTKLIDKSSPLVFAALTQPIELTCRLEFYRSSDTGGGGDPVHYYTITLEEAKIVSVETVSPNAMDPRNDDFMAYEQVTFTYGAITWEHEVCSTNATDNWSGA